MLLSPEKGLATNKTDISKSENRDRVACDCRACSPPVQRCCLLEAAIAHGHAHHACALNQSQGSSASVRMAMYNYPGV
jgi:hypothetical protein